MPTTPGRTARPSTPTSTSGWTYDYYFKRFGRRGLDNRDCRSSASCTRRGAGRHSDFRPFSDFYLNAFYCGDGMMALRRGPAAGRHARRRRLGLLVGRARHRRARADPRRDRLLVAPDLSERVGRAQRGVLRHHGHVRRVLLPAAGHGNLRADYLFWRRYRQAGGDPVDRRSAGLRRSRPLLATLHRHRRQRRRAHPTPASPTTRSIWRSKAAPTAHRGCRCRASAREPRADRARVLSGVHTDAAGERHVRGRAVATIQAARDLFGANSAAERAVTQAWTAVGVN